MALKGVNTAIKYGKMCLLLLPAKKECIDLINSLLHLQVKMPLKAVEGFATSLIALWP